MPADQTLQPQTQVRSELKIRRALITVSDKEGAVELAKALVEAGSDIIATGNTAKVLKEAGINVISVETISGNPEAFGGRMKTLSFPICSGILYRRGNPDDEKDARRLNIPAVDCVVVNFYPFEKAAAKPEISREELIENVDIGGPTLVRAAAKNAPDVLVLTDPKQYAGVIEELKSKGTIASETALLCAQSAWNRILEYDSAIAQHLGHAFRKELRYGENPHQQGYLEIEAGSPIVWPGSGEESLTQAELSYNNILDVSAAYGLASDLVQLDPDYTGVVIIKHNNPCGVAMVSKRKRSLAEAQREALERAWEGDPISAFGGVVIFTDALTEEAGAWLSERFVELVCAPGLRKDDPGFQKILTKRKNLKAVSIRRFGEFPKELATMVPGGKLYQSPDVGLKEDFKPVTRFKWTKNQEKLGRFGVAVCRALKSNAIAIVRELEPEGAGFQLIGAGQGQPNRVEALQRLAIPRAHAVLKTSPGSKQGFEGCILVSDAFFPFRDTVDVAHNAGLNIIVQPGGSMRDSESIEACDGHQMVMVFTGVRHFKH